MIQMLTVFETLILRKVESFFNLCLKSRLTIGIKFDSIMAWSLGGDQLEYLNQLKLKTPEETDKMPYFKLRSGIEYGECSISCENGETTDHPVCLRVAMHAEIKEYGNGLIYSAFANNFNKVIGLPPLSGGFTLNDVINVGKDPMTVRAEVLEMLKGHRVYAFNSKENFKGLYISEKDLKDNDIELVDLDEGYKLLMLAHNALRREEGLAFGEIP